MILKSLFSSQTRLKLLETFLFHPEEEFYIRELTRKLDEQINSIRRELDNLKKIGLVKSRTRNRKKFFTTNTSCIIFEELRSLFLKTSVQDHAIKKALNQFGEITFAALTGSFVHEKQEVDLLIVGNVISKKIEDFLQKEYKNNHPFLSLSPADFEYRIETKDPTITAILNSKNTIVLADNR